MITITFCCDTEDEAERTVTWYGDTIPRVGEGLFNVELKRMSKPDGAGETAPLTDSEFLSGVVRGVTWGGDGRVAIFVSDAALGREPLKRKNVQWDD